jgi:predicted dehydrogenase
MRINFLGQVVDEPEIRAGFIGCGSHSFRNIYPTFQFAPVHLVATCDLQIEKARAFAAKFGAANAYADYREMLDKEQLDAVFVVTGYDEKGQPRYPAIALDCLAAGVHVWMEKPPAATTAEIEEMAAAAKRAGKEVQVGLKKMFFPANEKAKALCERADFGEISLLRLEYPQYIPTLEEFALYRQGEPVRRTIGFLDHLCHPMAILVYLLGMPESLYYQRSAFGAGEALFSFASGAVASLACTHGSAPRDGMERTMIVSNNGRHIVVENNLRVSYHRTPSLGYGNVPDFYTTDADATTALWQPEFSLGQLYNKGLFLLGYYNEVNEFARAILEGRPVAKGTLEQAWQVTRIFEAFAGGPNKLISLRESENFSDLHKGAM